MAMWGIGLGGFAKGLERGIGLGEKMFKAGRERQKDEADDTAVAPGKAASDKPVAAGKVKSDDAGRGRDPTGRLQQDVLAPLRFDVAAGEVKDADVPRSLRFAAPLIMQAAVKNDDLPKLKFFSDWQSSPEAIAGARLFESGMLRATRGDVEGGWSEFQKLGKHEGYGGEYSVGPLQKTADGQFTTTVTAAGGRTFNPTFADPARFMAQYGNPSTAFEDSRRLALERANELARTTKVQAPGLGQSNSGRGPVGPAPISPQPQPGTAPVAQPQAAAAAPLYATGLASQPQPQPGSTLRVSPPPPDVLSRARDAIAKGADHNAVIKRLKENGFDASGF